MKKIKLSELKQLNEVQEIRETKMTDLKGGNTNKPKVIKIIKGVINHSLGFIPPPGI